MVTLLTIGVFSLEKFYSVEATTMGSRLWHRRPVGTEPTDGDGMMPVPGNNPLRDHSVFAEFVPMHNSCYEVLAEVSFERGLPIELPLEDDDEDSWVREYYVDFFVRNLDIDKGWVLKNFDYGLDLRELWNNTYLEWSAWEDVKPPCQCNRRRSVLTRCSTYSRNPKSATGWKTILLNTRL